MTNPSDYIARLPLTQAEQSRLYLEAKRLNMSVDGLIAQFVRDALSAK